MSEVLTQDPVRFLRFLGASEGVLFPAALHQCPQFFREGWMRRPWWASALGYGRYSHGRCVVPEWNRTSEYLRRPEATVSQNFARSRLSATHLDHDHRESENVCFLAMSSPIKDFWRSPLHSVTRMGLGTLGGIQVLSDRSEAKICETGMTRVVHKDV
jgi:hypothetical protein